MAGTSVQLSPGKRFGEEKNRVQDLLEHFIKQAPIGQKFDLLSLQLSNCSVLMVDFAYKSAGKKEEKKKCNFDLISSIPSLKCIKIL